MYHLRNKVYVDIASRVSRSVPYISIGPYIGFQYAPSDNEVVATQIEYATSLDKLDPAEFKAALSKAFAEKDKVFIYADGQTYLRLYAMLIKALLPGVTLKVFRRIMLCKKATFNSLLSNTYRSNVNVLKELTINGKVVEDLYTFEDQHQAAMTELVTNSPDDLSLEWRLLRLFTEDRVGKLPKTLRRLIQRVAVANTQDTLDIWGRMISDPSAWEFAGCDIDTLLNGETVFEGAVKFRYLTNPIFLKPGLTDTDHHRDWYVGLLAEQIKVLEFCGETPTANCSRLIHGMLLDDSEAYNAEGLKKRFSMLFSPANRLALPALVAGKYDENLIRYVLSEDVDVLRGCAEGAQW